MMCSGLVDESYLLEGRTLHTSTKEGGTIIGQSRMRRMVDFIIVMETCQRHIDT